MRFNLPGRKGVEILISHPMKTTGVDEKGIPTSYTGLESGMIFDGVTRHTTLVSTTTGQDKEDNPYSSDQMEEAEEYPALPSANQVLQDDTPVVEALQRGSTSLHHRDESDLELERMQHLENSYQGNSSDTVVVVSK